MVDRRRFIELAAASALAYGLSGAARAALNPGRDFNVIGQPLVTESQPKIEVLEFFWYGCPHCFDLEPLLNDWKAKAPADVALRRVPAIFRESWEPGARMYYSMQALGVLDRLHAELFRSVHLEHLSPGDDDSLSKWAVSKGVDGSKFAATYKSFAVESKIARAKQLTRASRIEGVPALIVEGKYLAAGPTHAAILSVVDQLVAQVRAERGAKKQ